MRLCNVLRKFHAGSKRLALVGLCFGALGGAEVAAQVRVSETSPGVKSVYFPSNTIGGSAVVFEVPSKIVPSSDGGLVKGTALVTLKNPSGQSLPVTASGRASSASVGAAVSKFIGRVATPIAVGSALYDLFKELGYDAVSSPSGELTVTKQKTGAEQCQALQPAPQNFAGGACSWSKPWRVYDAYVETNNACYAKVYCSQAASNAPNLSSDIEYSGRTYLGAMPTGSAGSASSVQEFIDSVAAKSGWPTSSNVSRVLVEAEKLGIVPDYGTPSLSGPSSTPGSSSTSVNSDGSSSTTTTTHNHTYAGSNITTTNVTVTTVTNTNGSTSTTTTTETPAPEKEPPPDQCKTNPDSVGCQKTDVPTDEVPKSKKTITWAEENLGFGNGSCPAPYTFRTANGSYSLNLAQYCDVLSTVVRPVVLAFALLAAFFIVAPVRTET